MNLFPGLTGGGGSSDIVPYKNEGGTPTRLNGNDAGVVSRNAVLPATTTPAAVQQLAQRAGNAESQAWLLAQHSKYSQREVTAALNGLQTRVNHARFGMNAKARLQQILGRHNINIMQHELMLGTNQAYVNAWESNLQGAQGIFQ